jgi:hypothetical protein
MEPPAEVPGHHTLEPAMEVAQQVAQPVPVPAPAPAPAPAAAHEAPVGDASAALIAGLGDLTQWSDAELADMASGLGVPLDALQRRQALQRKIAQARAARTPEA